MHCPECEVKESVKNGKVRGLQRYKCKGCGCNYTQSYKHGYPQKDKILAVVLHLSGMSLSSIGGVIGVTAQSVMRWIRAFADTVDMPAMPGAATEVELDEMHHFLLKKLKFSGSGKCWIIPLEISSGGSAVIVVRPPEKPLSGR
jgi:transposase